MLIVLYFQVLGDEAPAEFSQNKSINKKVVCVYVELVETRCKSYIASLYINFLTLVELRDLCFLSFETSSRSLLKMHIEYSNL